MPRICWKDWPRNNRGNASKPSVRQALQRQTQALVNRYAREYSSNHIYNLAAIVADVETGEVLAYAGNSYLSGPTSGGEPSGHHYLVPQHGKHPQALPVCRYAARRAVAPLHAGIGRALEYKWLLPP